METETWVYLGVVTVIILTVAAMGVLAWWLEKQRKLEGRQ